MLALYSYQAFCCMKADPAFFDEGARKMRDPFQQLPSAGLSYIAWDPLLLLVKHSLKSPSPRLEVMSCWRSSWYRTALRSLGLITSNLRGKSLKRGRNDKMEKKWFIHISDAYLHRCKRVCPLNRGALLLLLLFLFVHPFSTVRGSWESISEIRIVLSASS